MLPIHQDDGSSSIPAEKRYPHPPERNWHTSCDGPRRDQEGLDTAMLTQCRSRTQTEWIHKGAEMNWNRIEEQWETFTEQALMEWSRLSDEDLAFVAGRRAALVEKIEVRYRVRRMEAERQVSDWLAMCAAQSKSTHAQTSPKWMREGSPYGTTTKRQRSYAAPERAAAKSL